jgi:peptidoglycan hydrolase-like protein with peptidoglycan-binding domain
MSVRFCALGERGGSIVVSPPAEAGLLSASVGFGGVNRRNDVVLIQSLLNLVPSASGGPTKPLKVDGIVGPLTIGAIRRFQSANIGFSDGRVDPGGQTLARLSALTSQQPVSSTAPSSRASLTLGFAITGAPAAKPTPLAAAIAATPLAKFWVGAAILHLSGLQQGLIASGGVIFFPAAFNVVNTHFHLDRDPSNILINLGKAIGVFNKIVVMLSDPTTFYREGPETADSKFADAPMGGFSLAEPNHHITIRPQYPDCGPNCQSAMLVHEGAHFCGGLNEIRHFAHEFPVPDGEPQDGSSHNYAQMTADEGMRNAASYAAFAIQAFFSQDLRFGLDKKAQ